MILLIRTDMSGLPICEPQKIQSRAEFPLQNSTYYSEQFGYTYQHVVNLSYSADDKHSLFKGVIHAIYTIGE